QFRARRDRRDRTLKALLSRRSHWWAAAGVVGVMGVGGVLGTRRDVLPTTTATLGETRVVSTEEAVAAAVAPTDANALGVSPRWDLPNLDHPRVDYWVQRFTTDPVLR